jgi:uncharacterized protein (DUF1330 family)
MAKGYWLAQVDVSDAEAYKAYAAAIQDVLRKFGGRYVVRAGRSETMEGQTRSRLVTIVQGLRDRARLLPLTRIRGSQKTPGTLRESRCRGRRRL